MILAELFEADMGLFTVFMYVILVLGLAIASLAVESVVCAVVNWLESRKGKASGN